MQIYVYISQCHLQSQDYDTTQPNPTILKAKTDCCSTDKQMILSRIKKKNSVVKFQSFLLYISKQKLCSPILKRNSLKIEESLLIIHLTK